MFGFRIITKREMLLWTATIDSLRDEVSYLKRQCEHERYRAENAVNLVLAKSVGAVLAPTPDQSADAERMLETQLNIFGDGELPPEETKLLEDIQS